MAVTENEGYLESVFLVYERKGLKIAPFVAFYFKPQYFLGHMLTFS